VRIGAPTRASAVPAAGATGPGGLLLVLSSTLLLTDDFVSKADNLVLVSTLLARLTEPADSAHPAVQAAREDRVEADAPEFGEAVCVPDTEALAERLRCCLQETEELPVDFSSLFDPTLFKYDTHLIPEAVRLYERLNVRHEPLSLIPPQFEVPLPPLQPAVFMPCMREQAPPALDLFDLDEHFSTEKLRLAQITNKCSDADLEYFICECGEILGIADAVRAAAAEINQRQGGGGQADPNFKLQANKVMDFILRKLLDWKKLERDEPDGGQGGGQQQEMEGGGGGAGYDSNVPLGSDSQSMRMEIDSPPAKMQQAKSRTAAPLVGALSGKGAAADLDGSNGANGKVAAVSMQMPQRRGASSQELDLSDD